MNRQVRDPYAWWCERCTDGHLTVSHLLDCKSLAYEFETLKLNNMKEVIKKLNEGLKDPEYRQSWIANIAMAQIDCERWYREENNKVGKYLNAKDRHAIANKGAEYFLELLSK